MTRAEQAEKRRWEILNAALDLFIRKGFGATKIDDIAQAVGMSKGLMFHYFESKEALYNELLKYGATGPQSIFALSETVSEPMQFFEVAATTIMDIITTDNFSAKMFIFVTQSYYSGISTADSSSMGLDAIYGSVPLIEAGQAAGTVRDGDPLSLSLAFWSAITGVAQSMAYMRDIKCPDGAWFADILRKR